MPKIRASNAQAGKSLGVVMYWYEWHTLRSDRATWLGRFQRKTVGTTGPRTQQQSLFICEYFSEIAALTYFLVFGG